MKRIDCIIFDLDGTLTQTNELIYATFNHIAKKYLAMEYSPPEITKMFGPPEDIAIGNLVGKDRLDDAMADFYSFYEKHHPKMAGAYDGVKDVLDFLKGRGTLLALFTGKGKRSTLITLNTLGIRDYFDFIVTGHDVRNHKPSADGIRQVLSRFHLPPESVLMVGDAVADIAAAREARVPVAAALWDSYGREAVEKMDVDFRFHSVREFADWLKTILPHDGKIER